MLSIAASEMNMDSSTPATSRSGHIGIAVGISTSGRPVILGDTLLDLQRQTRQPDDVYIIYSKPDDIADLPQRFPEHHFIHVAGGNCEKRNWVLDAGTAHGIVFFMDDDFYLDPKYLQVMEEVFVRDPSIVAATGVVVADGAKGPGLTLAEARPLLDRAATRKTPSQNPVKAFNTYGCNMAFRLEAVRRHQVRFDTNLPAYAWYEDIDFSRRLARHGSMVRVPGALGVHLGAKVGRVSGVRLGYSQVANPLYLARKGSYPWRSAIRSVARNATANLFRSIAPESYIDRRGRLQGNLLAVGDLLRGRMHPSRVLHLQ